ncbi:MAG: hypothetical protein JSS79_15505 [Bacteroidetes bacterium]|nr:hypothetical protein [Bacteroidota bacterium]
MRYVSLSFLLISFVAIGQNRPSKKQVRSFLSTPNSSYDQSVLLTICNTNDAYFKSDTVKLYNDYKANWFNSCCQFVDWDFDEKKLTFNLIKGTTCTEPSRAIPGHLYEIRIVKEKSLKIIVLDVAGNQVDKFRVIELKQLKVDKTRDLSQVLILVREIKPTYPKSYEQLLR